MKSSQSYEPARAGITPKTHKKFKKIIIAKTFSFFLKEKLLSENEPQNPKNLKKMLENIFPQMSEQQFLKTLIFPRVQEVIN